MTSRRWIKNMQKPATQSTTTQGITQEVELNRVLGNPDNFLVSAGFEEVFEEMTSKSDGIQSLVNLQYAGVSISAPILNLKLTDRIMKLELTIAGNDLSKWISSHSVINSPCEISSGDYFCKGFISSISCSPRTSEYHSVKYTILIDKNT